MKEHWSFIIATRPSAKPLPNSRTLEVEVWLSRLHKLEGDTALEYFGNRDASFFAGAARRAGLRIQTQKTTDGGLRIWRRE